MDVIKGLIILVTIIILLFPILPFGFEIKKLPTIHALKYDEPHNKKNIWFVFLAILECALIIALTQLVSDLVDLILSLDFIRNLLDKVPQVVNYVTYAFFAI